MRYPWDRLATWSLIIAVSVAGPARAGALLDFCGRLLGMKVEQPVMTPGVRMEVARDGFNILVNGHLVTGSQDYPVDLILYDLGLEPQKPPTLKGPVVSLGEGYSELLSFLRKHGIEAIGLDLWYGHPEYPRVYVAREMRKMQATHRGRLLRGDALRLPLASASVGTILSHKLANGLSADQKIRLLQESVRVLQPGGEARIGGFATRDSEELCSWLRAHYGSAIEVKAEQKWAEWVHPGVGRTGHKDWVLIVRKLSASRR